MDLYVYLIALVPLLGLVIWLSSLGWRRGMRKTLSTVLAALAGLGLLFYYLSTIATGPHLAGLGEMLVSLFMVLVLIPSVLIGIVFAVNRTAGLLLLGMVFAGFAILLMNMV